LDHCPNAPDDDRAPRCGAAWKILHPWSDNRGPVSSGGRQMSLSFAIRIFTSSTCRAWCPAPDNQRAKAGGSWASIRKVHALGFCKGSPAKKMRLTTSHGEHRVVKPGGGIFKAGLNVRAFKDRGNPPGFQPPACRPPACRHILDPDAHARMLRTTATLVRVEGDALQLTHVWYHFIHSKSHRQARFILPAVTTEKLETFLLRPLLLRGEPQSLFPNSAVPTLINVLPSRTAASRSVRHAH